MSEQEDEDDGVECPYCGEEFETENDKGVHISKEHVNNEDIVRKKRSESKTKDIRDDWEK